MGKHDPRNSPAFKRAFKEYTAAIAAGLPDAEIRPYWDAVMRTLHAAPPPPEAVAEIVKCELIVNAYSGRRYGFPNDGLAPIDRLDRSPLDDFFDECMREG